MQTLNYELAKTVEGQAFSVVIDHEVEHQLRLISVTALETAANHPAVERGSFTLRFEGVPGQFCAQKTYTLRNDTIGEYLVFIVPIGCQQEIYAYEAVFN